MGITIDTMATKSNDTWYVVRDEYGRALFGTADRAEAENWENVQARLDAQRAADLASGLVTIETIARHSTVYLHVPDTRRGAKAGATRVISARKNGAVKTWKTRPGEFRAPFKYGLRECFYVTHDNAHNFFLTAEAAQAAPAVRHPAN